MNVEREFVPCPLRCDSDSELVLTGRDKLSNIGGDFSVVRCRACGLMRTNPRVVPESIGIFYPDNYGPYLSTVVAERTPKNRGPLRAIASKIIRSIFEFNTTRLPRLKPGRMLEIGCASGAFMHRMANEGWQVKGIEFSERAAQAAKSLGYEVSIGPIETVPDSNVTFDLIVGWMVLEHLYDPVYSLQRLRKWSSEDTWLVLSVPNAGSIEFQIFRDNWYALQLPTHLFHFTPRTLQKTLHLAGWRLEKVHHQRVLSNLIGSLGYVARELGATRTANTLINLPGNIGRWQFFLYPLALLFGAFGQTGRMTVWARPVTLEKRRCGD